MTVNLPLRHVNAGALQAAARHRPGTERDVRGQECAVGRGAAWEGVFIVAAMTIRAAKTQIPEKNAFVLVQRQTPKSMGGKGGFGAQGGVRRHARFQILSKLI